MLLPIQWDLVIPVTRILLPFLGLSRDRATKLRSEYKHSHSDTDNAQSSKKNARPVLNCAINGSKEYMYQLLALVTCKYERHFH
jgi:hypothetical protein